MILLYVTLLLLLVLSTWLVQARVRRLEKRYSRLALDVDVLARKPLPKQGNTREPDAIESARRQYQLVMQVRDRDQLEGRYEAWQKRYEHLRGWVAGLTNWRGRAAPYIIGAIDAVALLLVLDYLGVTLSLAPLRQLVSTWITG